MATSKDINNLVINKVENQQVYDYMVENNLINDDELYLVEATEVDDIHTHTVADITDLTVSAEEINHLDGVTSNVQAQLDGLANDHMTKENPTGTGSFSMNRKAESVIGEYSHAEGINTTASGRGSHAEGISATASGNSSHAEGYSTDASGSYSHAEGYDTTASGDYGSHSEGNGTTASGNDSHAEGYGTTASGSSSHAEGYSTDAIGSYSHAEGCNTTASGNSSHAEGYVTEATGEYSHAEGYNTKARGEYQHVQGKYNIADTNNTYAHIVGNGYVANSSITRSNAHTLDWDGNAWFAGDVTATDAEGNSVSLLDTTKISATKIPAVTTDNEELNINSLNVEIGGLNWNELEELPYEFYGNAVVYNEELHIIGSYDSNYSKLHYKFDGSAWIKLDDLPYNFERSSVVVYNNEIHLLGGNYGANDFYYKMHYKFDGMVWTKLDDLPYPFYSGSAVVYNNEIHLLGGEYSSYSGINARTSHYKWNGSTWTQLEDLPYEFYRSKAVVYNNEIHLLGGWYSEKMYYKWNGSTWTQLEDLPYYFSDGSAVIYNDEIYAMGGNGIYNKVYKLDKTTSTWTEFCALPYIFVLGATVVYNSRIHIIGSSQSSYKKCHYKLIISEDKLLSFTLDNDKTIPFVNIDDETPSTTSTYSSSKIEEIVDDNKLSAITTDGNKYDINSLNLADYKIYEWTKEPDFIDEDYGFYLGTSVVYDNKLYALGGSDYYESTSYSQVYTFDGTIWTQLSDLPYEFCSGSALVYNNELHLLGGRDSLKSHYKFNGTTWTQLNDLPCDFQQSSAVVYNNEIHIMYNLSHYKYNGSSWTQLNDLPYKFTNSSALVYNNELHLLGSATYQNTTYHYKWNGSTWTKLDDLPNGGSYLGVVYDNEIHLFNQHLHYKWNGFTWTKLDNLPYVLLGGNAVIYNNKIHILGGFDEENYCCSCEHFCYPRYKQMASGFTIDGYEEIPIVTIDDYNSSINTTYSSEKIEEMALSAVTNDGNKYNINSLNISKVSDGSDSQGWNKELDIPDTHNGFLKTPAVVFDDDIYIISAYNTSLPYTDAYKDDFYKYDGSTWTKLNGLPIASESSAVVYDNAIHILGGIKDTKQHYVYNGSEWSRLDDLPYDFRDGSAVVYNGEIHLLGSYDFSTDVSYLEAHYKWDGTTWTRLDNLPYRFYSGSAVVYNGEIHIFGGSNRYYHSKFNGTTWTQLDDLPYDFGYGSAVVYNNEIHLLGGNFNDNCVIHCSYNGSTWTQLEDLPYHFYNGDAVVYNNEIHILGGTSIGNVNDDFPYNHYSFSIPEQPKLLSVTVNDTTTIPFVNIDDKNSSDTSTYSSSKIEELLSTYLARVIQSGTEDLIDGSSELAAGSIYVVYE